MPRIYLDNAATTPLDPQVIDAMTEAMREVHGNPSSIHADGRKARTYIEEARKTVAHAIGASLGEVFFTSGGTESSNMVLKGAVRDLGIKQIISSPIEHHCVLHSVERLQKEGVRVDFLTLSPTGQISLKELEQLLSEATEPVLVSLMHANNEVGTLLPMEEVAALCAQYKALFHSDTVQTLGFYPIDVSKTGVHFITGSAHKFYGPKGVGFVYINNDCQLKPYLDGGSQERNMRGGTENLYGIVGLAKALDLAITDMGARHRHILELKQYFRDRLLSEIPGAQINGPVEDDEAHYKVLSVRFPASDKAEMLLLNLDIYGISASGGSACSSGVDAGSHVLECLQGASLDKTIRFSFSHRNTKEELDQVVEKLREILPVVSV